MSHQSASSKVASANRVWSHNTNYTGAAGIHSEDGPVAHARNTLMDRRSSVLMTAEEEILKKKMKALSINRKSLETSMLSYSQKMKDISKRREQLLKRPSPMSPKSSNNINSSSDAFSTSRTLDEGSSRPLHKRNLSLPFLTDDNIRFPKDFQMAGKSYPSSVTSEYPGRISVDSGVGMESDAYISDTESITKSKRNSTVSVNSEKSNEPISRTSPGRETNGRGRRLNKRRRLRQADNVELPPVLDDENHVKTEEDSESVDTANVDSERSVTISPFPLDKNFTREADTSSSILGSISENEPLSDDLTKTRILNPLSRSPVIRWKNNVSQKPKKKTPHVLTKPKVVYSPSIAAMKMRRMQRKPNKKKYKPHLHEFKYSDAVETALRSLNSSPEGRRDSRNLNVSPSMSPDLPGLDLSELLSEVIHRPNDCDILLADEPEEFKPHRLFRERSFSEPLSKSMQFCSTLEQVREDDESEIHSVLRKNTVQYPAQKKTVQFFLPDIFLHANACTSQPAELR